MNEQTVSVRRQGKGDLGAQSLPEFMETIIKEVLEKTVQQEKEEA